MFLEITMSRIVIICKLKYLHFLLHGLLRISCEWYIIISRIVYCVSGEYIPGTRWARAPPAGRQVMFLGHFFIDLTVQISCFVTI